MRGLRPIARPTLLTCRGRGPTEAYSALYSSVSTPPRQVGDAQRGRESLSAFAPKTPTGPILDLDNCRCIAHNKRTIVYILHSFATADSPHNGLFGEGV